MIVKRFKSFTVKAVAGANVTTVVVMWAIGFSYCVNPIAHPVISSLGLFFPIFLALNILFLFFWLVFKWKMAAIPLLGFLVAYQPVHTYIPVNPRQDSIPPKALKVLSFNVKGYCGTDFDTDKQEVANQLKDYVRNIDADIVCLQEDLQDGEKRFPGNLYPYSQVVVVGQSKQNAVGIYTHYPILRTESIDYSSAGNGSVAFYLKIKSDTVIVINNHLESTHLSLDERQRYKEMLKGGMNRQKARSESKRLISRLAQSVKMRAPQADSVHQYILSHSQYPLIVCGDFNDNPISYARHTIAKGLTDCYVATGFGLGLSYNQKGFYVRIDNLMCSAHFKPYNCKVDNKIDISDHYPIICWLEKRDKP